MLPPEYEIFSDTPNEIIFNLKRILSYIKENRGVTTKEFENLGYDYIDCWHILTILKVDNVMREGQGSNRWREDSKGLGKEVFELPLHEAEHGGKNRNQNERGQQVFHGCLPLFPIPHNLLRV